MKKFQFSSANLVSAAPVFSGDEFYNKYKNAEFLRHNEHVETILCKGHELRQMMRGVRPGVEVIIEGMWLQRNTLPLFVRRTSPNFDVKNFEFTVNRLNGLVAAYIFQNRLQYPDMKASEALVLGLRWDSADENQCRLFLSAVSGTEHFTSQFHFWPLVCGLRKLQLKKITPELVIKMAKIKNNDGVPMGKTLMKNKQHVKTLWSSFVGATTWDFEHLFLNLPKELKKIMNEK